MKIIRSAEVAWVDALKKGKYSQRRRPLGGEKLQCSQWELAPGKKSFPLHAHHVTEEALFVISGSGKVRTPTGETAIGAGDFVSFPAGSEAHQLINDSDAPLIYLGMSVGQGFDIVEYPDSNKLSASVGAFPNGKRFIFNKDQQSEYFAGEQDAED